MKQNKEETTELKSVLKIGDLLLSSSEESLSSLSNLAKGILSDKKIRSYLDGTLRENLLSTARRFVG